MTERIEPTPPAWALPQPQGMTLRDAAALAALTGLLAGQYRDTGSYNLSDVPIEANNIADAFMLAAREARHD